MIKYLLALLLVSALIPIDHADAARRKLACWPVAQAGCPHFKPAPRPTPKPAPANSSADPTDTLGVIQALLSVKAEFVTDLQDVATMAATPDTGTGASWDPTILWCLNGTPAQGVQGQPGFIPAYPGLIAWVNSIVLPSSTTVTPPPVPAGGGIASQAEELWLQALAAYQDINPLVNSIVSNLTNLGPPASVMNPCGAAIQNRIQTVQNATLTVTSQLAMFNTILLAYMPKAAVLAHVRMIKH